MLSNKQMRHSIFLCLDQCTNGHSNLKNTFHWEDYAVLTTMLVVSCGIGLFYGFIGPKQATSSDFLLGGSSMGTFPMAMSLAARYTRSPPFGKYFFQFFSFVVLLQLSNYLAIQLRCTTMAPSSG